MSYMKRTIALDGEATSEPTGTPVLSNRKIEPMGRGRPPLRVWSAVPTELLALMDAVESAAEEKSGFDLLDIERVEAFWEMIEDCSTAHGFVLSLRDGSRVYLQYITAIDDERPTEEIEVLPMADERYPDLKGGGIVWQDEVDELNRFLKP
jgi:hypothetical protein